MPRTINVQVDTSDTSAGPLGVMIHDAIEEQDTSKREEIFNWVSKAVEMACGSVIEADYDKGRAMFGIWTTRFVIPTEAHTDERRAVLHLLLSKIWEAKQDEIQGFRIVWEGDRQDSMVDDMKASMDRFGNASMNLDLSQFSHLDDSKD